MQDLVAGQIDLMFDQVSNSLQYVAAARSRPMPLRPRAAWPAAPDIPTVDEAGLPGFYISIWHALWAPKGTPKDIIARLNAAVVIALADPAVRQRLAVWVRRFVHAISRRRMRSAPFRRPKSKNGGRSSRRRTSRRNEAELSARLERKRRLDAAGIYLPDDQFKGDVPLSLAVKAATHLCVRHSRFDRGRYLAVGDFHRTDEASLGEHHCILKASGAGWHRVARTNVLLTRSEDFGEMNRIYSTYFPMGISRSHDDLVLALPQPEFLIEIECEAVLE